MTEGLPPALRRTLTLLGPGARRWLPRLLEPVAAAPGDDRWRRSLLTPERFPVELSVSTASPRTDRYTTEFVSPARPPATRLAAGLERLERMGLPPPDARLPALLLDAHRRHPVVWGTWLAGRHDTRGDRFKLYAEVPKTAAVPFERAVARLIGVRPFPLPEARLRLVGIDLTTGAVERYHRVGRLTVADLRPRIIQPRVRRHLGPDSSLPAGLDDFLASAPEPSHRRRQRDGVAALRADAADHVEQANLLPFTCTVRIPAPAVPRLPVRRKVPLLARPLPCQKNLRCLNARHSQTRLLQVTPRQVRHLRIPSHDEPLCDRFLRPHLLNANPAGKGTNRTGLPHSSTAVVSPPWAHPSGSGAESA
ncbi:hypothetical protein [Streptomyces sp. NPDC055632]